MQYVDRYCRFNFLPVASNDNEDLLDICAPEQNLQMIQEMKWQMRDANAVDGRLLRSRNMRRRFQELLDAEHYILLRYFSVSADKVLLCRLKRHILDVYLFPQRRVL